MVSAVGLYERRPGLELRGASCENGLELEEGWEGVNRRELEACWVGRCRVRCLYWGCSRHFVCKKQMDGMFC